MQNQIPEVGQINIDSLIIAYYKMHYKKFEDPAWAIYRILVEDAVQLCGRYERIANKSNIAVSKCTIDYIERYLKFETIRNNETVKIDIVLRKIELKFYDEDFGGPSKYCFEIYVHKELANPGKLQQQFSIFLASDNHNLMDFITKTIWRHIDESVKEEEKKEKRKIELSNLANRQKMVSREKEKEWMKMSRFKNRCMIINRCTRNKD